MKNKTSQELEEEYRQLSEVMAVMRWDMQQEEDAVGGLLELYEAKCGKINDELVARGYWVE